MDIISTVLRVLGGGIALLYGRRVFWLFCAVVGFLLGFFIGNSLFPEGGTLIHLIVGIVAGLVGAFIARAAPGFVISIVGFVAGGYILVNMVSNFATLTGIIYWVIFLAGAIFGVILAVGFFDLALVVLSSLAGATTLASVGTDLLKFSGVVQAILFIVLAVIGIVFQLNLVKPAKKSESSVAKPAS